ncbi:hypothetical protein CLV24_11771 [Pontibacter ummariensis]|uniref:Uncharacterized protein n=1 Tax=Pontibacter ummariensis TaxID=1610492 RepID=A0A239ILX9_9BACT|nr:hypothetical protein CLV24_11771 [Pontibacter ummariensis]SNS93414.1 hypothetical protein SAMN06296052_11771 [Pontibacter ummariensis]
MGGLIRLSIVRSQAGLGRINIYYRLNFGLSRFLS